MRGKDKDKTEEKGGEEEKSEGREVRKRIRARRGDSGKGRW